MNMSHDNCPSCCRKEYDPADHPNHAAWITSVRNLMDSGVPFDQIKPFDGEPVATLKDAQ
jgi:hypothetical protein